jgi:hypothetical protein
MANRSSHPNETVRASQDVVDLTPEEVLHLAKPKEGFADQIEPLVDLYIANHGAMPGFDAETVRAELQAYVASEAAVAEQQAALALELKTRVLHASNAWRGGLTLYKWGLVAGQNNPAIKRGISRFEQFMKRKARKKIVAPPATSTASAGDTASAQGPTPTSATTNSSTS